ncbi:MAG: hypothetical protein JST22_01800 [Bacteroidetes bacterium]|nr:hypothetical protein [Bacteroidota bacterium]
MNQTENEARAFLRHTIATVAYRGAKALRDAPAGFSGFTAGPSSRSAGRILAHICDLYDWSLTLCHGTQAYNVSEPGEWEADVDRFFTALERVDTFLASDAPLAFPPERLFQGPVADSLTHIGQIAMMRRLAGAAVKGEDYSIADVATGRVGEQQSAPAFEFD